MLGKVVAYVLFFLLLLALYIPTTIVFTLRLEIHHGILQAFSEAFVVYLVGGIIIIRVFEQAFAFLKDK